MEGVADGLLVSAARQLKGRQRRIFLADVCDSLCAGSPRKTEERFGWGRETVAKGYLEKEGVEPDQAVSTPSRRGRQRSEEANPQLAIDIRLIVEPHTHADPELKTQQLYTNLSAAEVRAALVKRGYHEDQLPSERTLRDILNRMNYRLKRIQKGKPLKKTEDTDAIFENVQAAREKYQDDPATLEISVDTKTKVSLGEYSLGGKTRTDSEGKVTQGWDHDPPAKEKLVPFGILILATGALTLLFGTHETSDFWGDCLRAWWKRVRRQNRKVRRLAIYLDNGPKNSGRRTQFLKRMIEFADWSGLEIRLLYYPPYHSKYNPIERCWSSLQKKWNGVLLTCWEVVQACALRMTWKGLHPGVDRIEGDYPTGVIVPKAEMQKLNKRLERLVSLPKYDITIKPKRPRGR